MATKILTEKEKEEIGKYYKNHTRPNTCKKFNICYERLLKLLVELDIPLHTQKEGNFLSKMNSYGYTDFTIEQEQEIITFYKTNSFNITLDHFKIKSFYLTYLLAKYKQEKHSRKEELEYSSMAIYGTKHPSQAQEIRDKHSIIVSNFSKEKREEIKQKRSKTMIEKYGSNSYNNREKYRNTCLEKYGVDNVFKSKTIKSISKETKKNLYGDENFTNRIKAKETCLDKYGAETFLGSKKGKEAMKAYNQERYGVDWAFWSKEWQEKELEHKRKLHPNNYNNRDLASKTMLEKYGVEYYCITDECRNSGNGYKSKPNETFAKLLEKRHIPYEREFKLVKYSYDFKVGNILIEINPTATHNATWSPWNNEKGIDKNYHAEKTKLAEENGFRCVHIWDWIDIDLILDMINPDKQRIYGRKCFCKIVDKKIANQFIAENHLQKQCKGNIYNFGLYYNDELLEIMTFGESRYDKKFDLELLRACTKRGYIILGGTSKLWKFALNNLPSNLIVSYCDKSFFSGKSYLELGFTLTNVSINKHWYNEKTKKHILDSYLNSQGFDRIFNTNYGKGTSNHDLMLQAGFVEIYDAGQAKYTFARDPK